MKKLLRKYSELLLHLLLLKMLPSKITVAEASFAT